MIRLKLIKLIFYILIFFELGCITSDLKIPLKTNRECKLVNYPINLDSSFNETNELQKEYSDFLNSKNSLDYIYIYIKSGGYPIIYKRIVCDSINNWYIRENGKKVYRKVNVTSEVIGLKKLVIKQNQHFNAFCKNQSATPPFEKIYLVKNKASDSYTQLLCHNSNLHDIFEEERDSIKFAYIMEEFIQNLDQKQ